MVLKKGSLSANRDSVHSVSDGDGSRGNIRPAEAEAGQGQVKLHGFDVPVTRSFGRRTNRPSDDCPLGFRRQLARVGSLERVMHPPEGGPQAVFRERRAPRYPTGDNPASGHSRIGRACYHFATQLDGTRQARAQDWMIEAGQDVLISETRVGQPLIWRMER
jgi:hypothetical protein